MSREKQLDDLIYKATVGDYENYRKNIILEQIGYYGDYYEDGFINGVNLMLASHEKLNEAFEESQDVIGKICKHFWRDTEIPKELKDELIAVRTKYNTDKLNELSETFKPNDVKF